MAGAKIDLSSTTGEFKDDGDGNALVNTPGYSSVGVSRGGGPANAGASGMYSVNDEGTVTLLRSVSSPQTSQDRRLRVGVDTLLMNETFNATTQNTTKWAYTFATLTASQPGAGTLNFGTVQGTAATHGAFMRSFQYFPLIGGAPLVYEIAFGLFNATLVANEEWYCGFALPTVAGTAPTDGIWFKLTTAGLVGEARYNNSLAATTALATLASFTVGTVYTLKIIIGESTCSFWRDGILLGSLPRAAANGQPIIMGSLPTFMQKLCTGVVSNTNTIRVADIDIYLSDAATNKPWFAQMSGAGQSGNLGQDGHTQGKTSLWTNSVAPTAAALTNTAAAFTGLGGIVAVLPTLTVGSDGKLITYQNPASTINITGRNLYIKGVTLQGGVSVVFVGGPVTYAFAIAYGHTATSLATAETGSFVTATTHAPRIMPIGMDTYPVTAAVGTLGNRVSLTLETPIVIRPGEFFDIVARNVGVVTSSGAITYVIAVDAYFE